ncbi:hypothetical protein A2164_00685 [Candidatus Curtissbacteria bacterium RBG_13_35_7]|uniref:Membrane protein 6-pyruvoyl-tetrahydropterin synthase-related domain-containing protein n=1 Tax=Candidatus Curtissbacteria bacterium RBG_13_35_7 TaxID=1797705 RepID=A0A1F5G360_9BACT|nr:MAG: hypothetical protein A2164_00685 [Candidatus Curtissbacteria bacterium RBG_13_35_7]
MVAGFIFSGFFAYLWLKELTNSPKAAFLGALFYVWAPYRFLLIYVRASLSEHLAYTFLPLVLYTLTCLAKKQNARWAAFAAIVIALFLLSQNLVALISVPILGFYLLIQAIFNKSLKYVFYGIVSAIWGLTIASFTYLPSLFERDFTHFNDIFKSAYDTHFVTLKQLIRSPWGYGFDMPGTVNDQMSFQIGLAHLLILVLVLATFVYYFLQKITFFRKAKNFLFEKSSYKLNVFALFFLTVFMLTIFIMIDSKPNILIWQNFEIIRLIDLPWRFLGATILALSFLTAYVCRVFKPGIIFLLLVFAILIANRNHLRINKTQVYDDQFFKNYLGHATQFSEFTPKWRQTLKIPDDFDPKIKAEAITGQVKVINSFTNSNKIFLKLDVQSESAQVRINKFYFPGVLVKVDDHRVIPYKDLIITDLNNLKLDKEQDSSGLMMVNLSKGQHNIDVIQGETRLRLFADFLSLGSLIFALGIVIKNVKK